MANLAKSVEKLLEASANKSVPNPQKPAYPTNARMHSDAQGLTKRELFAMAAMQGIISNNPYRISSNIEMPIPSEAAKYAIEYADELLKQLEA